MWRSSTYSTHAFVSPTFFPISSRNRRCLHRTAPQARLHVEVLTLCKQSSKDRTLQPLILELEKRMKPVMTVSSKWTRETMASKVVNEMITTKPVIVLDEHGKMPKNSEEFSKLIFKELEQGGSRLGFVIGGADGISEDVKQIKGLKWMSLGPLTWTHKMVSCAVFDVQNILYLQSECINCCDITICRHDLINSNDAHLLTNRYAYFYMSSCIAPPKSVSTHLTIVNDLHFFIHAIVHVHPVFVFPPSFPSPSSPVSFPAQSHLRISQNPLAME